MEAVDPNEEVTLKLSRQMVSAICQIVYEAPISARVANPILQAIQPQLTANISITNGKVDE
jgi:hypothetical protein